MNPQITVGMRVAFDSEHGPQTGRVTGLLPCIGNGQMHAMIEMDGNVFTLPVADLTAAAAEALTADDYKNLSRMLGADASRWPKSKWGWRNYFCAGASDQRGSMQRLVDAGMARQGAQGSRIRNTVYYHATLLGCRAAGLNQVGTNRAMESHL